MTTTLRKTRLNFHKIHHQAKAERTSLIRMTAGLGIYPGTSPNPVNIVWLLELENTQRDYGTYHSTQTGQDLREYRSNNPWRRDFQANFCENKWPFGGVIGHWTIDFGEEDCLARWGKIIDKASKGCVKHNSKLRRYQARLSNIDKAEDWSAICSTAPVKIHGLSIPKPTVCENQGFWGVYGVWDVEDNSC
ncbi:hypothetical protein BJ912DRAFT_924803 [Pholiota molesta]|nr:hypothetical protein BJ912DRAFT_924803 [Pholiota molesta]